MSKPTVGSLFSGIGGLDLGLERAGFDVRWQVENDEYCSRVLAKHWPDVPRYGDIRELDGRDLEPVDVICGGFPCQPTSHAGRRRGESDDRWLWPEMLRLVREVRPAVVLGENVFGLVTHNGGLLLASIVADLEAEDYEVAPPIVFPALAIGAPHLRQRVWIVANRYDGHELAPETIRAGRTAFDGGCSALADASELQFRSVTSAGPDDARRESEGLVSGQQTVLADPERFTGSLRETEAERSWRPSGSRSDDAADSDSESERRPSESRGERGHWATEPDVGRVAYGVPARMDRLRALGNAVVPQAAEYIGKRLIEVLTGEPAQINTRENQS